MRKQSIESNPKMPTMRKVTRSTSTSRGGFFVVVVVLRFSRLLLGCGINSLT